MASEPRVTLAQVCSKIELVDKAKILQQVDGLKLYPDVSSCVRECIRFALANVTLDKERQAWVKAETEKNINRRLAKRSKKVSFLGRIFGRK